MRVPLLQVDAFASHPFSGNPAAVCLLEEPADEIWMQALAAEMNLSETAFVVPGDTPSDWHLRWFTPTVEVDLCGHATLAAAHVLWEEARTPPGSIRFHSHSGVLGATVTGNLIELDFPARPPTEAWAPPDLVEALAVEPAHTATDGRDWLVELRTEAEVRAIAPDIRRLAKIHCRGTMVTAPADESTPADVVSRFFAPASGVDEDPVTGSAHCCLGPWWAERFGTDELVALQVSARGGEVRVRVAGDRVHIGGAAVTVFRGELVV